MENQAGKGRKLTIGAEVQPVDVEVPAPVRIVRTRGERISSLVSNFVLGSAAATLGGCIAIWFMAG